jgi:MFS family permease
MPRAVWLLIVGMGVNTLGSSFLWPLNTIYIHEHLGKSLSVAGLVLMVNAGANVVGNLYGGHLFDKIGGYKSILLGISISLAAIIGLSFWNGWPEYMIFLTILGFGSGIVYPPMYAMVGLVWKEGERKSFNYMYISVNLGVAVGTALAGVIADYSFQLIFFANTIMYIIFLLIAVFGYRGISISTIKQENNGISVQVGKSRANLKALLVLCSGYLLCMLAYVQWTTTIASHIQDINISLTQYSLLWTVNGAFIVLFQPILNNLLRNFSVSLKLQILIGITIFIVSFIITGKATVFSGFLIAMTILTLGEMFVWPAIPIVAFELAPKGKEGFFQGIVNSTANAGRMIGPLLGGILVDLYGMNTLFTVLISLLFVSAFSIVIYDRHIKIKKSHRVKAS